MLRTAQVNRSALYSASKAAGLCGDRNWHAEGLSNKAQWPDSQEEVRMVDPFEALFPPTEGDDLAEWYRSYVVGTYVSNWEFLRTSASSSFLQAVRAVSGVLQAWEAGRNSDQQPVGETSNVLFMNYRLFATGPLLSATLTPVFALEAFSRHALEIGIRRQVSGVEAFELAVGKGEALPLRQRLELLARLSEAESVPPDVMAPVDALVEFRNATVHDAPLLHDSIGNLLRVKRGTIKPLDETNVFRGEYPVLGLQSMPLNLGHARQAVDAHDGVVQYIEEHSSNEYWTAFMQSFGKARTTSLRIKDLGGRIWRQWEALHDAWNQALEWDNSIPAEERESYFRDLVRREVVKPVEDDVSEDGT